LFISEDNFAKVCWTQ